MHAIPLPISSGGQGEHRPHSHHDRVTMDLVGNPFTILDSGQQGKKKSSIGNFHTWQLVMNESAPKKEK